METFWAALDSSASDLRVGAMTEGIGRAWRRMAPREKGWGGAWRRVRLSSAMDLPQIMRSRPSRLDSWIIFPDVAAMKVWKGLTTILKT
jgi:hypothetical protein